jgi:hypothetical protein
LPEREAAKAEADERAHWKWLGIATRNLLLWIAAIGSFLMVLIDAIVHFGSNRHG